MFILHGNDHIGRPTQQKLWGSVDAPLAGSDTVERSSELEDLLLQSSQLRGATSGHNWLHKLRIRLVC